MPCGQHLFLQGLLVCGVNVCYENRQPLGPQNKSSAGKEKQANKSVTMTLVTDHKKKNSKILIRYFQKYNI